jgi:hypothetical protein
MRLTTKVTGGTKLDRALARLGDQGRYNKVANAAALRIHKGAVTRAMRLPKHAGKNATQEGRMYNKIVPEFDPATHTARVVNYAPYAVYVEFGTGQRGAGEAPVGGGPKAELPDGASYNMDWPGMAAIPHMHPAAEEERPRFAAELTEAMRNAARGAA